MSETTTPTDTSDTAVQGRVEGIIDDAVAGTPDAAPAPCCRLCGRARGSCVA